MKILTYCDFCCNISDNKTFERSFCDGRELYKGDGTQRM